MLLRILKWLDSNFSYIIFWICFAQGIIGLISIFIFPPLGIAMIFLGLLTIGLGQVCLIIINRVYRALNN